MSDETLIHTLQMQLAEANRKLVNRADQAKNQRSKLDAAAAELATLRAEREELSAELRTWKAKAESLPGEKDARIAELEGQVRSRDHREAFQAAPIITLKARDASGKEVERTLKLRPEVPVEDAWAKCGYKAEGETPAAEHVAEQLRKAHQAAPWLFADAAETAETPAGGGGRLALPALPNGRGEPDNVGSTLKVRRSDLSNPDWMRINQATLSKAVEARSVVYVD